MVAQNFNLEDNTMSNDHIHPVMRAALAGIAPAPADLHGRFITITEAQQNGQKHPRKSTLAIRSEYLEVIGNLPHYYGFKPATAQDRDLLVDWLSTLDYTS